MAVHRGREGQTGAMRAYRDPGAFQNALQVGIEGARRIPETVSAAHELQQLPWLEPPWIPLVLAHVTRESHHDVSPNL